MQKKNNYNGTNILNKFGGRITHTSKVFIVWFLVEFIHIEQRLYN